jgi:hypothetical protein
MNKRYLYWDVRETGRQFFPSTPQRIGCLRKNSAIAFNCFSIEHRRSAALRNPKHIVNPTTKQANCKWRNVGRDAGQLMHVACRQLVHEIILAACRLDPIFRTLGKISEGGVFVKAHPLWRTFFTTSDEQIRCALSR